MGVGPVASSVSAYGPAQSIALCSLHCPLSGTDTYLRDVQLTSCVKALLRMKTSRHMYMQALLRRGEFHWLVATECVFRVRVSPSPGTPEYKELEPIMFAK